MKNIIEQKEVQNKNENEDKDYFDIDAKLEIKKNKILEYKKIKQAKHTNIIK